VKFTSYRLNQDYFISKQAYEDLNKDATRKQRLDEKVESDLLHTFEVKCEEAKWAK